MANSQGHLIGGTIAGVGLALLLSFFGISPTMLFIGAIICIAASEFPDIDHDHSIPRKIIRGILPGLVGVIALYIFFSWRFWKNSLIEQAVFVAFPFLFLATYEHFIPRHRGAVHKWPGLLFLLALVGVLAFFLKYDFLGLGVLILFAAVGFSTHIVLDYI